MTKEEMIVAIISAILGSSVLTALITHILYSNRLRKEFIAKNNDMISKTIGEGLVKFRDTIQWLNVIEVMQVKPTDTVNMLENKVLTMEILTSAQRLKEYADEIHDLRMKYEQNMPVDIALELYFLDMYLLNLGNFIKHYKEEMYESIGAFIICDLNKWYKKVDRKLIKYMNKYTYKLEPHDSLKWKVKKRFILYRQWKDTVLYYFVNGRGSRRVTNAIKGAEKVFQIWENNRVD